MTRQWDTCLWGLHSQLWIEVFRTETDNVEALPSMLLVTFLWSLAATLLWNLVLATLLYIPLLYRPPSSPVTFFDILSLAWFWKIYVFLCTLTFVLLGDFSINVDVSHHSYVHNFFCNVINQHALTLILTGHTHVTNSSTTTINLMLSTSLELIKSC